MATLDNLKRALRDQVPVTALPTKQALSEAQYQAGFGLMRQGSGWTTYTDFIIPRLSERLAALLKSRISISALEIGPGPKSVFGCLPETQRRKIKRYTAFEPNSLFATTLAESLDAAAAATSGEEPLLPSLQSPPRICQAPFTLEEDDDDDDNNKDGERYDIILFCHSMYGMRPKRPFVEKALKVLAAQPDDAAVVIFHRMGDVDLDGLVCHQTAWFPGGSVSIPNRDEELDVFSQFVAGCGMRNTVDAEGEETTLVEWRKVCRTLGRFEGPLGDRIFFAAPDVMVALTRHATALPELTARVPLAEASWTVKNRDARLHRPAAVARPTDLRHIQECVWWALQYKVGLSVVSGGHGGHCVVPNVVAIDMGAFNKVYVVRPRDGELEFGPLIVAGAGAKTEGIVSKAMEAGLTVPLGSRPSVGAGLWLQGGIGHLARLHGLACDAVVGAVMVNVVSGEILCLGRVPAEHRPAGAVFPEHEEDLLWAIKGAGTNFGVVVGVVFKAYTAPTYLVRNWVIPLRDSLGAAHRISEFDIVARELPRNHSADAYLYMDAGRFYLGVTTYESCTDASSSAKQKLKPMEAILGPESSSNTVDGIGLFETEMYMSGMHGGHGGGKTSSFKRCVFLKDIGTNKIAQALVAAVETRPTPLCYVHLLHGGGAVAGVAVDAAAFGCRRWDFACVVTGVWPRGEDGTDTARATRQWVYETIGALLPLSVGVYGADLGPDPRDLVLSTKAFGPNRPRLARLKQTFDPHNIMRYACPLPGAPMEPKLIILVTGASGAGKDYCAAIWTCVFNKFATCSTRTVSISDAVKREYAEAAGADAGRLLEDRTYKEQHRPALTAFFHERVRQRPRLPEEQFLNVVYAAVDVDVLLITGMRDQAPVATFSHLVPNSRVIEVYVTAGDEVREGRRGSGNMENGDVDMFALNHHPDYTFSNNSVGDVAAGAFAKTRLLPLVHDDLQRLGNMIRSIPDFPRQGVEFRHVLGIAQQPSGLALCMLLFERCLSHVWAGVGAVVCCEAGGFVFASAFASKVNIPLTLIRRAGKLPPPTISVFKSQSHISSSPSSTNLQETIEMERDAIPDGASVVVVDDVLATGKTLCAVLHLLNKAGVDNDKINIMVVAEFPAHRGREALSRHGFGNVGVQSLVVFGGL
ncbi:hypothetical protein OQA88_5910 [Cercophora sp. LCS_1]